MCVPSCVQSSGGIICLNEVKTAQNVNLPGFKTCISAGPNQHRVGCAVLVRNHIAEELVSVSMDCSNADMIVFRLRGLPVNVYGLLYLTI